MKNDPAGDMIGAKGREPQILEPALDNKQWHAGLAGDLVNAAEHRAEVVAIGSTRDDANRERLRLHGSLLSAQSAWLNRHIPHR